MAVSIAEYLGQRTDVDQQIVPVAKGTQIQCPFMDRTCDKASKVKNPTPPVCSVRKPDGTVWIVCEHRLCSTRQKKTVIVNGRKKQIENILVEHQRDILRKVAKLIYQDPELQDSEIGVRREVNIPLPDSDNSYHADYVMNRPGFPGEYFICELRLPDHRFRWKHNKLFLLLPEEYGPAFPAIVDCYTSPPT
ncbi:NotI family restriction endonuclease [Escherichia coli]|uniref:NotI family restriction endonuclease n=1 Tax=Escherichia coli TaxID=562 RepID=UPI0020C951D6|nr:NotI family restriction endonuclease [Escherichia coli]UTO75793.1 NotI family restriction endonuclease [Escherichia coli]UTP07792.1 NotI family restriction endonuclease [Escherichia coli]